MPSKNTYGYAIWMGDRYFMRCKVCAATIRVKPPNKPHDVLKSHLERAHS